MKSCVFLVLLYEGWLKLVGLMDHIIEELAGYGAIKSPGCLCSLQYTRHLPPRRILSP